MDSWALEAIEKAAMARALEEFASRPDLINVAGLSIQQVMWLKRYYEVRTGQPADQINPNALVGAGT